MFSNAIQVPGRVNSEDDVFNVLSEISPLLDNTCNQWLNMVACHYINPACDGEGACIMIGIYTVEPLNN